MLSRLAGAATWRLHFLLGDPVFRLRERLAYVNPMRRQLSRGELVSRSLRRTRGGEPYFALGGFDLFYVPGHDIGDEEELRRCVELVLRETFLQEELFCTEVALRSGDTVLDLGGSIGAVALQLARRVGKRGEVHSFEPLSYACLERNVRQNRARNVRVVPMGVSERPGQAELEYTDEVINASIARAPGSEERVRRRSIELTTVDEYVENNRLERVDLIKIDIEGAEELALRGALRTLGRFHPRLTIASYHTDHMGERQHPKLMGLLGQLGYQTRELAARRIYAW
jgi:FkbM family methyltransferase